MRVFALTAARQKKELVGEVTRQLVLDLQLLFFQPVKQIFIRVGSMLFLIDHGVERSMLG